MTPLDDVNTSPLDRREYPRVRLNPDLQFASLAPRGRDALPVPLLDLSPGGAAVLAPAHPSWLNRGDELSLRAGAQLIPCRALSARASRAEGVPIYGLRLGFEEPAKQAIAGTYHKLRFGSLQRRGELQASALHKLFVDSGYLALKADLAPSPNWMRADWPSGLTHEAVYVASDERALGHVTVTRAYPRAWLGHEIATVRDHVEALACRRMLYQHFSVWPRLLDGDEAHLLGYYNRARPWHRKMFEDFAASCRETDCLVLPMDRYTTRTLDDVPIPDIACADGARVAQAREEDGAAVARIIEGHWPPLAIHAFDIAEERLTTDCMHTAYSDVGLRRSRTVLVLIVRDEIVGAALCEWSDSQISLFNVLNMAQLFLARGSHPSPEACDLLAQAVRRFYAERGAPPPLIACPPATFKDVPLTGCNLTETMGCIIWNAEGLRLFEQYVERTLANPAESAR